MKKITLLVLLSLIALSGKTQDFQLSINHVKGQQAINGFGFVTFNGFGGQINYEKFKTNKLILNAGIEYEQGNVDFTDYQLAAIYGGGGFTLAKLTKDFYLHGTGSIKLGFENLKSQELNQTEANFIVGAIIGINIEYYITNKIGTILYVDQIIYMLSDLGNQYPKFGIGIKYVL